MFCTLPEKEAQGWLTLVCWLEAATVVHPKSYRMSHVLMNKVTGLRKAGKLFRETGGIISTVR